MHYISAKAVHRLIGNSYPLGVPGLVKLLEEFCHHLESFEDSSVSKIPRRLLKSNLGRRSVDMCEMARIDADIRINLNLQTNEQTIALLNYPAERLGRPAELQRMVLHILIVDADGLQRAIHVPFQALLVGWGDVETGFQGYAHSISFFNDQHVFEEERFYVGISSRNWLRRMNEHLAEVRRGSNKLFHRQWREYQGNRNVIFGSELAVLNHTYEGIMEWEELIVRQYMESGTSLNMIPGGFEGMKFLHEHRLTNSPRVSLEQRDRAVDSYVLAHPRAGVPNLLVSQAWKSDKFYEKVVTGRENTLTANQVRMIRALAVEGFSPHDILARCGARNLGQVNRVINGTSYSRIN